MQPITSFLTIIFILASLGESIHVPVKPDTIN